MRETVEQSALEHERSESERRRLIEEYRRRERDIEPSRYAPWNPAEILMRAGRLQLAARMLHRARVFPRPGDPCLEVGCGALGWLADLLGWGLRLEDLHGIELIAGRAEIARRAFPGADLRIGDATAMPWADNSFRLVIASTVFTSVLDSDVKRRLAGEIVRVLAPGGALLWYDFRIDNPRNPQVAGIGSRELRALFPQLGGRVRSVTLAPSLIRLLAPHSPWLAVTLESIPLLRTHLIAVLVKADGSRST